MSYRPTFVTLAAARVVFGLALMVDPADAAEFKSGEQVVVETDQIVEDDLYLTGDTMIVKGRVRGDVVAAGRVIRIEGTIEGDLVAAAQVVEIVGEVLDDVRIAGLTLRLGTGGRVGDDLFAAGFSFESEAESRIDGGTGLTGYQARLSGDHGQSVEASVVGLTIEGRVVGDVHAGVDGDAGPAWWVRFIDSPVEIPVVPAGLTLGDRAEIEGDLVYRSTTPASISDTARISGRIDHELIATETAQRVGMTDRLVAAGRTLIVLLVFGAVLFWVAPDSMSNMEAMLRRRPVASLGWGLVVLLGVPVAVTLVLVLTLVSSMAFGLLTLHSAVALMLVLGSIVILILAADLWIGVVFVAPVLVGAALGERILARRSGLQPRRYLGLAIGLLVVVATGAIPFLGALVRVLVTVVGLGAVSLWTVSRLRRPAAREIDSLGSA